MFKNIRPANTQIVVEILDSKEIFNTSLEINTKNVDVPQGIVRACGPNVDTDKMGFNVGDRVVIVGNYTPLPRVDGCSRELAVMNFTNVLAVLER